MSKASEYAKAMAMAKQAAPELRWGGGGSQVATVTQQGWLVVPHKAPMSPEQALELSDWILDTFGEVKDGPA